MTDSQPNPSHARNAGASGSWTSRPLALRPSMPMEIEGRTPERRIGSLAIAERWLLVAPGVASLTGYRLHERPTPRALARLQTLIGAVHPHVVTIESVVEDESRHVWLTTPYMGHGGGDGEWMTSLERLLARRGGRLPALEVTPAVDHIRTALSSIRAMRLSHPGLSLDQIVVCARGMLHVELAGVSALLESPSDVSYSTREQDERVAARLGAQLFTGEENAGKRTLMQCLSRRDRRRDVVRWIHGPPRVKEATRVRE